MEGKSHHKLDATQRLSLQLASTLSDKHLFFLETGKEDTARQLADFSDLAYETYLVLKGVFSKKANHLTKDRSIHNVAREMVYFCYTATEMIIGTFLRDMLINSFKEIQAAWQEDKPSRLTQESTEEDFERWSALIRKADALDRSRRRKLNKTVVRQVGLVILTQINHFITLHSSCGISEEETFLISLFGNRNAWPGLLSANMFVCQHFVEPYTLSFAFFGKNNLKLAVVFDEYPQTQESITYSTERDRFLRHEGWQVLHFRREEIETNVEQCSEQVHRILLNLRRESQSKDIGELLM